MRTRKKRKGGEEKPQKQQKEKFKKKLLKHWKKCGIKCVGSHIVLRF